MRQISAEVYPVQLGPVRTAEVQATNYPDLEYFVYANLMVHQFCIYIKSKISRQSPRTQNRGVEVLVRLTLFYFHHSSLIIAAPGRLAKSGHGNKCAHLDFRVTDT